ncbi:MAG TPA: class D sortase [Thermoanaerobaculia bacterium]|jgi:sortase A
MDSPTIFNRKLPLRWIERLLMLVALLCLGSWAYAWLDTTYFQYRQNKILDEALNAAPADSSSSLPASQTDSLGTFRPPEPAVSQSPPDNAPPRRLIDEGALMGRIEIPRVGVSAIVLEGDDGTTLRRGVGHIPETSFPGVGNVGLAAHRDSFFRGLKDIRKDDIIKLSTLEGTFRYRVEWTQIVTPENTEVLHDDGLSELTLVTCYPFHYVGSAPKRFIVRAREVQESDGTKSGAGG